MKKENSFKAIAQSLIDRWVLTSADQPATAESLYAGIVNQLSIKMRLSQIDTRPERPDDWYLRGVRSNGFATKILNVNLVFADVRLGDFKDQDYLRHAVIPRYHEVLSSQQWHIELVKTKILGLSLGYDRMILPQKNRGKPEWLLSLSHGQFLLKAPKEHQTVEIADEAVIQLLIEGCTAKEIAVTLEVSPRTVEHRLEKLKERYGARNTVHLAAIMVASHVAGGVS